MVEITEYWNKLTDDPSAPFGKRVLPEYEIHRKYTMQSDFSELKTRWKDNPRMKILQDKIVEDTGKYYGIHSYIEIKPV
jgi:hypothetical protein